MFYQLLTKQKYLKKSNMAKLFIGKKYKYLDPKVVFTVQEMF